MEIFSSQLSHNSRSQLLYRDLGLSGHQEFESCAELDDVLKNQIPTTLISQYPVSLTLYLMSGDEMLALNDRFDPSQVRDAMKSVMCEDSDVLWSLLNRLTSLSTSQSPTSLNSSYHCGWNTWTVLRCGSTSASPVSNLLLCANCSDLLTNYCALSPSDRSKSLSVSSASHYSISCSDPPSDPIGELSMLYLQFNEQSPPPSFSHREVISVTNTSVEVKVIMSDRGYLLCGSYLASSTPSSPSSSEVLAFSRVPVLGVSVPFPSSYPAASTVATYVLTDLIPSSSYKIYCTSLSFTSVPMPTEVMLDSQISVKTLCCRLLSVTLNQKIVDDVSVVGYVLTLDVGSEMVDDFLKMSIEVNSSVIREMFAPSVVTFSSSSSSLKADLTYIPVISGSYRLNVTLSGPSSSNYRVVFPAGDVLVVKGVEEVLSPPLAQLSEFSSDGSKIRVTFQSPTNRGGVVNVISCMSLFQSTSHSLPSSSRCVWLSDSSLQISSFGSLVEPGHVLGLRRGVLKARCTSRVDLTCSSWKSNDPQNVTISVPPIVKSPLVVVSMASELGPCDDLVVDLSSSSGSGGRPWKSVSFELATMKGQSENISLARDFLSVVSSNLSSVKFPTVVPRGLLRSGSVYSLKVRLCNFLGGCGWKLKGFVISSSTNVPVVLLNTRDLISIFRNASLSISGDAYTSVCGGAGGRRRGYFSFSWSLSDQNNVILSYPEVQSVSVNPREFKLPAYRLAVGSLYKFTLIVSHLVSMKSSSTSVSVLIESGDLVCVLVGGDELGLRVDGSLLLDLSRSIDSNVNPNSNFESVSFELSCLQISPSYRNSCSSLIFSSSPSSQSKVVVTADSSSAAIGDVFQIVARGRPSSSESVVAAGDVRNCEKVVKISILASLDPMVRLDVLSGSKINPSSKLKILGRVDMGSSGEVRWLVNDDSIVLSSVSLSPLSRSLPSSSTNSPHVISLVLLGNSLPSQSSFKFTLSCSLANGFTSSNSLTITTNSPPFGGVLDVSPVKGVMLETVFWMFGSDWVDEDLPLSYQFGYLSPSSSASSNGVSVFRSKLQLSFASTTLPSGPPYFSNLTCVVMVFDQLDSSSRSLFGVMVEEVKMSADDLKGFLLDGINSSRVSNNSDDLKSILSTTASVLNRVNCSGVADCVSLNRMECWSTEGTCGECLDGFMGLMGSSNTPCLPLSDKDIHRTSVSACDSDADCVDGLLQECNPESHLCQSIQQTCPNSCSGHGRCVLASKFDLAKTVDECAVLDGSCMPRCECEAGFMGSSCSLREDEFLKQVDLRHLMVQTARELVGMENVEISNVKSWMKTLSSVSSSDSFGLSKESKILMSSLAIDILRASRELGVSIEDLKESGMDGLVDICVSGLEGGEGDLLMSLMSEYSDFVASDMCEDQYPVVSVNPFFRSSSFFLSSSSSLSSSSPMSLPQTDLESLGNISQHSVSLPIDISFPLQISISETFTPSPSFATSLSTSRRLILDEKGTTVQLSLPLFISLSSFSSSSCSSGECVMRVMLQRKLNPKSSSENSLSPNAYVTPTTTDASLYFEADCVTGEVKDHEFLCPSGEELVISCNGSVSGRGRRFCPTRTRVTLCETKLQYRRSSALSSSSFADSRNLSCAYSPSESNESVTTCLCNLSALGSALEGISHPSGSVSFTLLSIEKSVVSDFVSTWETISSLSSEDVAESWIVLVTIGGVALCFLLVLVLSIKTDKHESRVVSSIEIEAKHKQNQKRGLTGGESGAIPALNEDRKLIEDALPLIFKSDSLWNKFLEEMKVYHRWLGIVFYYSPEFPRAMRVLSLFSSIVIMLFVQSVTYNIADPDDGSCESCEDESCCLSLRSTLNSNEDCCYWEPFTRSANLSSSTVSSAVKSPGSCHFRDIGEDMTRMFIVAIISAVVSAPLALSIQHLIMNVLSKHTALTGEEAEKERVRKKSRRSKRISRRVDVTVPPSVTAALHPSGSVELDERCGRTLLDDLNNLSGELFAHYTSLLAQGQGKRKAKEFRSRFTDLI
jgi:hypothetical protein